MNVYNTHLPGIGWPRASVEIFILLLQPSPATARPPRKNLNCVERDDATFIPARYMTIPIISVYAERNYEAAWGKLGSRSSLVAGKRSTPTLVMAEVGARKFIIKYPFRPVSSSFFTALKYKISRRVQRQGARHDTRLTCGSISAPAR